MDCPDCGSGGTRVRESRAADHGAAVRRRRACSACGHRFTTYERREEALFVRKRDGARQQFDRAKLREGLARAAHKRPVEPAQIDRIVDAVAAEAERAEGELAAERIGEICLAGLRDLDRGAYLQYAGTLPETTPEFARSEPAGSVRGSGDPV
jgi:transcriptional repressor NrdR